MKKHSDFNVMDFARPNTKVERIAPTSNQFVHMVEITVSRSNSEEADFWAALAALGGEDVGEKYQFVKIAGVILDNKGKPEFCMVDEKSVSFWWDFLKTFSSAIGVVFWVHEYATDTKILVNIVRK